MPIPRRRLLACLGASLFAVPGVTLGQTRFPERSIRLLVGFGAGGTPDAIARVIAESVTRSIGQPLVVDNRVGANGMIAAEALAKAAPDGYTLLLTTPSVVINPSVYKKLPYDVERDLLPVTNLALGDGYLLIANPSLGVSSVTELVAWAKKKNGVTFFSSPGIGNTLHLAAQTFSDRAGIEMTHVPYKSAALALNAVISGEVQAMFIPPTVAVTQVKAGKVNALGFTGAKRWDGLPAVPTVAEALPGFTFDSGWHGLFAPAKTSAPIVQQLNAAFAAALQDPKVRDFLVQGGYTPAGGSPADFKKFVQAESLRYATIVRAAKITPE